MFGRFIVYFVCESVGVAVCCVGGRFVCVKMVFVCRLRAISEVCRVNVCFCIFVVAPVVSNVRVNCRCLCAIAFCLVFASFVVCLNVFWSE